MSPQFFIYSQWRSGLSRCTKGCPRFKRLITNLLIHMGYNRAVIPGLLFFTNFLGHPSIPYWKMGIFHRHIYQRVTVTGFYSHWGNIYEKWSKATKRRIQKVGEVEDAGAALGNLRKLPGRFGRFGLGWVPPKRICEHFVVSGSRNIMFFMYVGNDDASPNYSSHKRGWITFIWNPKADL